MDEQEQPTSPAATPVQPDVQPEAAQTAPTPEAPAAPVPEEPTPKTVAAAAVTESAPQTPAEDPAPSAAPTAEEDKPDDSTVQSVSAPVAEQTDIQPVAPAECTAPVVAPEADIATAKALVELKTTADSIVESIRLLGEATAKLDARLATLEGQTGKLVSDFSARLRFDAVKDEVISQQGKELDGFRRGAVAKDMAAVIDNLIFEIDGTRRIAKRLAAQEPTEANYRKAVEALVDGAEALEDSVLSRASVKSFTTSKGSPFDTAKHVLAKDAHEDTQDRSKDGLVAKSVRCGYERTVAAPDGQTKSIVVRPEQVAVWRFVEEVSASQTVPVANAMPNTTPPLQTVDTPVETPAV